MAARRPDVNPPRHNPAATASHMPYPQPKEGPMPKNMLYLVVGALAVAVAVLGYQQYVDSQKSGVEISIGEGGVSIEEK